MSGDGQVRTRRRGDDARVDVGGQVGDVAKKRNAGLVREVDTSRRAVDDGLQRDVFGGAESRHRGKVALSLASEPD